ncbi:glycosyltransferase involved in cell wall biosynthesis [Nonomuraea soli]|uniref:Glycosyltransferase involved in cell wall biosynthesis n=1 Tax=Nonomuraea soli TaxID=1032476 RepID=A0A7W0CHQ5_9ACTN|nr:glycosyltransferase [Nonomuraea soli]MBA2891403.1 glycosyltransferase involved in cell wall biosynthesis [Nonomuraea soli]
MHVTQPVEAGVAGYVKTAALSQVRRGWTVTVASPTIGTFAAQLTRSGVVHHAWEAHRSPATGCLDESRRLRQILKEVDPDVVHLHSAKAGLVGRLVLRGRRPTLFQPHGWSWLACTGGMTRAAIAWERAALRWSTAVVCVGEGEAALGAARGLRDRLVVIRNGVDLDRFAPAGEEARLAARVALGIPSQARLALCVGRLAPQKGQDLLLRAWPAIRDGRPDALLALVGDGELEPRLRASASPDVRFVGAVGDARSWYAACDVVVMPSRWEGLPLTALEAMATGRGVVAFDVPGLAEIVRPGTGALVPAGDHQALGRALGERLDDPVLMWDEGQQAVIRGKDFDMGETMDRLADLTMKVAGRD